MNALKLLCNIGLKGLISSAFKPIAGEPFHFLGIGFTNKVGLAAGFDKNASYLNELEALGFGFVEIGTVTPLPQQGNVKPRLFRLPKDKALINRMGFNNDGVAAAVENIKKWQLRNGSSALVIGGNIGKNKVTPNEAAWQDYETCFIALHSYVHYFVVNVSSPNTPGLRELQEKDSLAKILTNLQLLNHQQPIQRPILLKIAPDLSIAQIDDVISLALEIKLDGLVTANTTISRENLISSEQLCKQTGGLSGQPLKAKSSWMVQYITEKTGGQLPVIASGGIFTGADAKEKFDKGASLVQVWTGFVYEGPAIVANICKYCR